MAENLEIVTYVVKWTRLIVFSYSIYHISTVVLTTDLTIATTTAAAATTTTTATAKAKIISLFHVRKKKTSCEMGTFSK